LRGAFGNLGGGVRRHAWEQALTDSRERVAMKLLEVRGKFIEIGAV
jgi:hypothetical protein